MPIAESYSDMESENMTPNKKPISNGRDSTQKAALSKKYQKKSQLEHILLRPDVYIGSAELTEDRLHVFDEASGKLVLETIQYSPGLYKIFDEILVNAADHKKRDNKMRKISVTIDKATGVITVSNDGKGIPVESHSEHGVYIPELLFGHLLTGENFHDKEKRFVGGKNGYGAKLANIFSEWFTLETVDSASGKKYVQKWEDNMRKCNKAVIVKAKAKDYTTVSFKPDYTRFGTSHMTDSTYKLLCKRVYDIAGVTPKSVRVSLNGEKLPVNCFKSYVDLYNTSDVIHAKIDDHWEICIGASTGAFEQISFVNSISTFKGGKHVDFLVSAISKPVIEKLKKDKTLKGGLSNMSVVKKNLQLFINCLVPNPSFDSQCKTYLATAASKFETKPVISDSLLKNIMSSDLVEQIKASVNLKQLKTLQKQTSSTGRNRLKIDKLDDANKAGTSQSYKCTLILTEGDSAKSLAVAGLSKLGRDFYGVFPLRGKLLNVRDAANSQISANKEIQNMCKIVGLVPGKPPANLRYGKIMVMTDQDHDGSHIKGLLFNFIHNFWPKLLEENFLQVFITPIVKATKKKEVVTFYTLPEYEDWLATVKPSQWAIKYYKGLGTSTSMEAKEYFSNLQKNRIGMKWSENSGKAIIKAFSKKMVDERKGWLANYDPSVQMRFTKQMTFDYFVDNELIQFSMADNIRSIPSAVDGFKPSQRKVMYGCFKKQLFGQKKEIKVAQLSGYVSEVSAYHHGEQSLQSTIVHLAQDFVGANNINLLFPSGQFGSRLMGGKDSAASRYIFTYLNEITATLFRKEDESVLDYQTEEGEDIEPHHYVPIIPMALVNGAHGIGTGWSTDVPMYNPMDLVAWIRARLVEGELPGLFPWYRGYKGQILQTKENGFSSQGLFDLSCNNKNKWTLRVTELPINKWTEEYKKFLNAEEKLVISVSDSSSQNTVDISAKLDPEHLACLLKKDGSVDTAAVLKKFKLEKSMSTNNLVLFDAQGKLKSYSSVHEICEDFFMHRLELYTKRKACIIQNLEKEVNMLDNRARFVLAVVEETLPIFKRKKAAIEKDLSKDKYDMVDESYNYLLNMNISSLTKEKVDELLAQRENKKVELKLIREKKEKDIWNEELDEFEKAFHALEESSGSNQFKQTTTERKSLVQLNRTIPEKRKSNELLVKPEKKALAVTDPKKIKMSPINDDVDIEDVSTLTSPEKKKPGNVSKPNVTKKSLPKQKRQQVLDSDSSDVSASESDIESVVSDMSTPKPVKKKAVRKKKSPPKKVIADSDVESTGSSRKQSPAKAVKKKKLPARKKKVSETKYFSAVSDSESITSAKKVSPVKAKKKLLSEKAKPPAKKKIVPKGVKQAKKPSTTGRRSFSSSEDGSDDAASVQSERPIAKAASTRPKRAAAKVVQQTYNYDFSSDEDEIVESDSDFDSDE